MHRLLIVTHSLGGGIERHVADLQTLLSRDVEVEILRSLADACVSLQTSTDAPLLWRYHDWAYLVEALRARHYQWISFHHLNGYRPNILTLADALNLPYDLTVHDFFPFCPIYSLSSPEGVYCGEPELAACEACAVQRPNAWGWTVARWRAAMQPWLEGAQRVTAPSQFVADRVQKHFPQARLCVWPHPPRHDWLATVTPMRKILLLGGLSQAKGLGVLLACARWALEHKLDLSFCLLGYTGSPLPPELQTQVQIRGQYDDADLPALIALERADAIWFPGQIPETYSYTLDLALACGSPLVASKLGAVAERLQGLPGALLVSHDAAPSVWCEALLAAACRPRREPVNGAGQPAQQARQHYRQQFLRPMLEQPALARAEPVSATPAGIDLLPCLPSTAALPVAVLFAHGVECGHQESKAALKSRLSDIAHDYSVLEHYARRAAMPWHVLLERAESQAEHLARHDLSFEDLLPRLDAQAARLRDNSAQLAEQATHLKLSEAEIDRLNAALARASQQLNAYQNSTSWRFTAPLRAVGRGLKSAKYKWHRLRDFTRHALTRSTLAWAILRSDGWRALMERVRAKMGARQFTPFDDTVQHLTPIAPLHLPCCSPATLPRVSIVIPVYGQHAHTFHCLHSLAQHTRLNEVEVIVVDDASPEPVAQALAAVTGVVFLRPAQNGGFIESCRLGSAAARGEFLVLLNNDIQLSPDWLDKLLDVFQQHPEAGLVGARLVYPNGRLQEAGGIVWQDGSAWNWGRHQDPEHPHYRYLREVDYCSGACLAMRLTDWVSLGGFDPLYAPAYYEDADLAFRVRQSGKKVYYQPESLVIHFEGVSCGTDEASGIKQHQVINQRRFFSRWQTVLQRHQVNGHAPQREADRQATRRVLVVEATMVTPDQDAGSVRMLAMLQLMVALGCKVSIVADNLEYRQPYVRQLQQAGVEVWHHPFVGSVAQLLEAQGPDFDVIMFCRHYIAVRYLTEVRRWAPQARVIFDTVDLHYLRQQRQAELDGGAALFAAAAATRTQELGVIANADLTLVVSPAEKELLATEVPAAKVAVLPTIYDIRPVTRPLAERAGLIFVGGFRHPPNLDAITWFISNVWPRLQTSLPGLTLTVVGSNMPNSLRALAGPGITFCGFVEQLEPLLDAARVSIAPLRYGAGVKGKINEAMACGLPVVATTAAVEGMHLHHGEHLLLADTPEDYARAVVSLYTDEALWHALAEGGKCNIRENFSRAHARDKIAGLLGLALPPAAGVVDIIIPVYGQMALTQACLASVLAARQQTAHDIIVIDDASPDPQLAHWLDTQASAGHITLLRNASNQGFVASVNRGMTAHPDRDVVLLNSDTRVHGNWLDRLRAASQSQARVASVTPWSNNATICSYPQWPQGGELPAAGPTAEALDTLVASVCPGTTVALPTAVGFCMLIRRDCLQQVGLFDQAAFGKGYGEENDFCLRASQAGFHHLLAADTYVYHAGNASFADTSDDLKAQALKVISARWPQYPQQIERFLASDPLAGLRRRLDAALAAPVAV